MAKKVLHIVLLFVVLFSSTSMVLHKHYCSDQLKDVALMAAPESCHAEDVPADACHHSVPDKDDCCSDETYLLKAELNYDLYQPVLKDFSNDLCAVLFFFFSPAELKIDFNNDLVRGKNWRPPSPTRVFLPLLQQFLC